MLVDAQVSSMKTSRSRSSLPWLSRQASRRFKTFGRSCSVAWAVFFTRDLVTLEEAADRAIAKGQALFAQAMTQFLDGDIGRCLEQSHDRRLMAINPMRLAISALSSWLGIALHPLAHSPAAHACRATPNRSAACRPETPLPIQASTRSRRSIDSGFTKPAGLCEVAAQRPAARCGAGGDLIEAGLNEPLPRPSNGRDSKPMIVHGRQAQMLAQLARYGTDVANRGK